MSMGRGISASSEPITVAKNGNDHKGVRYCSVTSALDKLGAPAGAVRAQELFVMMSSPNQKGD